MDKEKGDGDLSGGLSGKTESKKTEPSALDDVDLAAVMAHEKLGKQVSNLIDNRNEGLEKNKKEILDELKKERESSKKLVDQIAVLNQTKLTADKDKSQAEGKESSKPVGFSQEQLEEFALKQVGIARVTWETQTQEANANSIKEMEDEKKRGDVLFSETEVDKKLAEFGIDPKYLKYAKSDIMERLTVNRDDQGSRSIFIKPLDPRTDFGKDGGPLKISDLVAKLKEQQASFFLKDRTTGGGTTSGKTHDGRSMSLRDMGEFTTPEELSKYLSAGGKITS